MLDVLATIPKAELHCHCDGILDPPMLRGFAAQGLDVEPIASALEALRPITSLESWIAEYQPLAATFLNPLAERLRLVALAQRSRWRLQNVQYAELFVSGILGAIADPDALREWFRAQFLGVDASGREILSFLPGVVPDELGKFSDVQLAAAARVLRSFHDATAHSELAGSSEVVCHGDASPCNFVFLDGVPVALIDFDAAHPGRRRDDLGYAAWLWLDVGGSDFPADVQGMRIARFFQAYGANVTDALDAVVDAQVELAQRRAAPEAVRLWAQFDDDHSDLEDRFIAIGPLRRGLVMVVWTERDGDVVRIISARWATRNERALFRSHIRRLT